MLGVDGPELCCGFFVSALIKEVLGQEEVHLRHLRVLVVLLEEGAGLGFCVLRLQLESRQRADGLRIPAPVSQRLLDGLRIVSVFVKLRGFLQVLRLCLLHLRAHQNHCQCYLYLLHLILFFPVPSRTVLFFLRWRFVPPPVGDSVILSCSLEVYS